MPTLPFYDRQVTTQGLGPDQWTYPITQLISKC